MIEAVILVVAALATVKARHDFILSNLRLVWRYWRCVRDKAAFRCVLREDAISAGVVGLIEAFDTWNPAVGTFSTHAMFRIRHHIWCEAGARLIRLPPDIQTGNASESRMEAARKTRTTFASAEPDGESWEPWQTNDPDPPWMLDGWEEVQEALRFVHPVNRVPLLLHYRDGLQFEEIAARLGCTRQNVRQWVSAGEERLSRHLGIKGFYWAKAKKDVRRPAKRYMK